MLRELNEMIKAIVRGYVDKKQGSYITSIPVASDSLIVVYIKDEVIYHDIVKLNNKSLDVLVSAKDKANSFHSTINFYASYYQLIMGCSKGEKSNLSPYKVEIGNKSLSLDEDKITILKEGFNYDFKITKDTQPLAAMLYLSLNHFASN